MPQKGLLEQRHGASPLSDGVQPDDGNIGTGADPVYRLEKL
jgi:hypothetical protein